LSLNYTYLKTRDKGTGQELARRPRNIWNAALGYSFRDYLDFRVDANFRSSQKEDLVLTDAGGRFRIGRTPGAVVLDAAITYHIVRNSPWASDFRLVGKVNNILDEDGIEEFVGFPMPGINFLAGIEWLY
jgi:outer membrane receptor for ferrienterochelin and colicin